MIWESIAAPPGLAPPRPMTMRAQSIPARHAFPEHAHDWNQVVYAISGVLTVGVEGRSFVISPEQAVWLPTGLRHRVGTLLGAEFRSLWIAEEAGAGLPEKPTVFGVSPLLRALIVEAAAIEGQDDRDGYAGRVTGLILDQLRRAQPLPGALPWPRAGALTQLCEALYADPADPRGPEEWGQELGMSGRTLARRFEAELGMSLRSWRRRLRLFKAVELLGGGLSVTQTAMELGYGSTSAFVYAFRTEMGCTPQAQMRGRLMGSNVGRFSGTAMQDQPSPSKDQTSSLSLTDGIRAGLRRATPADTASVRDLTRAAYAKWVPVIGREPKPMTVDYDVAVRDHIVDLLYLDGTLVALIEMRPEADHLLIVNVAVSPPEQGRGYGRALLAHADELTRSLGLAEIRLYTNGRFTDNVKLYERAGYRVDREEVLPHLGTVVHMSKRLP